MLSLNGRVIYTPFLVLHVSYRVSVHACMRRHVCVCVCVQAACVHVMLHGNHTHTTCSHMCSQGNAQECAKTVGFAIMQTELPRPTCTF